MELSEDSFKILYINTYAQTKFSNDKQLQLQDLISTYKCDIIHLQEVEVCDEIFQQCQFIKNNFIVRRKKNIVALMLDCLQYV